MHRDLSCRLCGPFYIFISLVVIVLNSLNFIRVESFQVQEFFWEMAHVVKCNQVSHTLLAIAGEAGHAGAETTIALGARLRLSDSQGE